MRTAIYLLAGFLAMAPLAAAEAPPTPEQEAFRAWQSAAIPDSAADEAFIDGGKAGLGADLQVFAPSLETKAVGAVVAKGDWLLRAKVRHTRTGVLLDAVTPGGLFGGADLPIGTAVYALSLQTTNAGEVKAWCAPQLNDQGLGKFVVGACVYQDARSRAFMAKGDAGMSSALFTNSFQGGPRPLAQFPRVEEKRVSFETPVAVVVSLVDVDREDVGVSIFVIGARQVTFLGQQHPRRDEQGGFELRLLGKVMRFTPSTARNAFQLASVAEAPAN